MDDLILYSVADRVARITLNRPEKRNALSFALRRQLIDAVREAEADDAVTVVLIDGAGPSFSAGYDLADQRAEMPPGWVESEHFDSWTDQFARSISRDWIVLWDLLKVVVAKVHGYCLAGGTELMSMCDIAFVADDATIGYPPMRAMSTPDTLYFPWKLSMAQAKYLQLTGNSVTGKEAAAMGWVAKSFAAEELEDQVQRELRPLAQVDPALLAANKASVNQAYELMGMRTHLLGAWQWHQLTSRDRRRAGEFGAVSREQGLRAAIDWRDGPFRQEGFPP
jgi:enoyl-CoA hydratase